MHAALVPLLPNHQRRIVAASITNWSSQNSTRLRRMVQTSKAPLEKSTYGLRGEVLSPMETLAQSISTIAPTTTPVATIPLVCALAGNGTWLAYVLDSLAILVVAVCV